MQTNVKVEKLDLFNHADSRVAIIVANGKAGFNDVLHVFMTNDALAAWLKQMRQEYVDVDFRYVEDFLGTAVNYSIWNDVEGMSLHSVVDASFDVTREDLTPLAPLFDAFGTMTRLKNGRMSMAEASDILKHKEVYFLGTKPTEGQTIEKRDIVFGKTIVGESLTAFLTEESANAFAQKTVPVSKCKLKELVAFFDYKYSVCLEPARSFSIVLPSDALR